MKQGVRGGYTRGVPLRPALTRFNEYAEREPTRFMQILTVIVGVGTTVAMWERRGAVAGLVALVIYGVGSAHTVLRWDKTIAWSKDHPFLDGLLVVPLLFLALAYLTDLGLLLCLAIAACAGVALMPLQHWLRRRRLAVRPAP